MEVPMKVDVAINYYGKPQQTALTIASLLQQSRQHIGLIYLACEAQQPRRDEDIMALVSAFPGLCEVFRPSHYFGWRATNVRRLRSDASRRHSVRYQYALEKSDKPYVLVTHNDVVYHADLVRELLSAIATGPHAGAGLVGQCWNCPAFTAGLCSSDRYDKLRLTYWQALHLSATTRSPRTYPWRVSPLHPVPLPECRLNEFACLFDTRLYRAETTPCGSSPPLGVVSRGKDLGSMWFRSMMLKGHTFAMCPSSTSAPTRPGTQTSSTRLPMTARSAPPAHVSSHSTASRCPEAARAPLIYSAATAKLRAAARSTPLNAASAARATRRVHQDQRHPPHVRHAAAAPS